MDDQNGEKLIEILLVEDNPGDVRLTQEAWREGKVRNNLYVVADGAQAMAFLRREGSYAQAPRPDLILIGLNLPGRDGMGVLADIKQDPDFRRIAVVIITTSREEISVVSSHDIHADCYITKPVDLDQFIGVVKAIEDFWVSVVKLPPGGG